LVDDHLFNSSGEVSGTRSSSARCHGMPEQPQDRLPKVSQETLAATIGNTRSRVNFLMNKFMKLGFVKYSKGGFCMTPFLLRVFLHE
jgi:CRP/FNR family cyclic AMP-dependent transcriptional regulator